MPDTSRHRKPRHRKSRAELIAELEEQDEVIRRRKPAGPATSDLDNDLFQTLFEQFPLGVTVEDYSDAKHILDRLPPDGVDSMPAYLRAHPDLLYDMVMAIRLTDANENMIKLFHLSSYQEYLELEDDYEHWKHTDWRNYYIREFTALQGGQKFYTDDYSDVLPDGTPVELRCITLLPRGYEDSWARVITTHEDITTAKETERSLVRSLEEAKSENRAKSEFLANMSHELRTPLNSIIGFSSILGMELYGQHKAPEYLGYAHNIQESGEHLLRLIDDLLDLSRIEADRMKVHPQTINLPEAIAVGVKMLEIQARNADVRIEVRLTPLLPDVWVDGRHFRQILVNLLSNAIKFSRQGNTVLVEASVNDIGQAVINVSDTGIGIAIEDIPKILEPFGQVSHALNRSHAGAGLGLPIARSLTNLNDGHFGISSTLGQGTTVTVRFAPNAPLPAGPSGSL